MKTKLAILMTALPLMTAAHGALLFYEGFDYTAGALDGKGGWTASTGDLEVIGNGVVDPDTVSYTGTSYTGSYSGVTTTGGYITEPSGTSSYANIALSSSVTSSFTDGSVTWFSAINVRGRDGSSSRYSLAIGAAELSGFGGGISGTEMAGQGIGFSTNGNSNATSAAYWNPNAAGADVNSVAAVPGGTGRERFEVAKITWGVGAGLDTIEIAFFDAGVTMTEAAWNGASKSTASFDLDQSTFDTLSLASSWHKFDEIRIASDFDSAISGAVVVPEPSSALLVGLGGLVLLRRRR